MRKIPVNEAIGQVLGHDIIKIIPGREKCRAFRRGQIISAADVPLLQNLGKEHIYIWEAGDELIHEDEAALRLAQSASGPGINLSEPSHGRVNLMAAYDGLLKIQVDQLHWINNLDSVIFATLHNNRTVVKEQKLAGTRVVPLAVEHSLVEEAEKLCSNPRPLISVKPFKNLWTAVITTGNEVCYGRIKDGFGRVIRKKITPFGGRFMSQTIVPDSPEIIAAEIKRFIGEGADFIIITGGMSVDPDDVTPLGIKASGAEVVFYGAPVLPGSQFMLAYQGHVPICGMPGGALYSKFTTLDLLLPRIFAEERINRSEIVALGHGGFCEECKVCHFPACPFGKATYL